LGRKKTDRAGTEKAKQIFAGGGKRKRLMVKGKGTETKRGQPDPRPQEGGKTWGPGFLPGKRGEHTRRPHITDDKGEGRNSKVRE